MKKKDSSLYTVIFIGNDALTENLSSYMIVSCSNQQVVAKVTGISKNRLEYLFSKKKLKSIRESGMFIIKSEMFYKGSQRGGNQSLIH